MSSYFTSVPIRGYTKTDPSWWNALRAAGAALETIVNSLAGGGGIPQTAFTLANNQSSAANITGMLFDSTVGGFVCEYRIYRQSTGAGATELAEQGVLYGAYSTVATTWALTNGPAVGNAGVTFSILASGQAQYQSTNITGTANISKIVFSTRNFPV